MEQDFRLMQKVIYGILRTGCGLLLPVTFYCHHDSYNFLGVDDAGNLKPSEHVAPGIDF